MTTVSMTREDALSIIADLAYQDRGNGTVQDDGFRAVRAWREEAGQAGDLRVVEAIDLLGMRAAGQAYEDQSWHAGQDAKAAE